MTVTDGDALDGEGTFGIGLSFAGAELFDAPVEVMEGVGVFLGVFENGFGLREDAVVVDDMGFCEFEAS